MNAQSHPTIHIPPLGSPRDTTFQARLGLTTTIRLLLLAAISCFAGQVLLAEDGVREYDLGLGSLDDLRDVRPLSDGSFIVAGQIAGRRNLDCLVARMLPNGDLDDSFGDDGLLQVDLGKDDLVWDIKAQSTGRWIAVAQSTNSKGHQVVALGITPDGKLDKSFGFKGRFVYPMPRGVYGITQFVTILPDDSIILSGRTSMIGTYEPVMFKLTPDGELDPSFGDGGIKHQSITGADDHARNVVYFDGKLYQALDPAFTTGHLWSGIAKYDAVTGELETSFADNGILITSGCDSAWLAVQSNEGNGRLLLADNGEVGSFSGIRISAYTVDGDLDTSFGVNGVFKQTDNTFLMNSGRIKILDDDTILMHARTQLTGYFIAMVLPDGSSFNPFFGGPEQPGVAFTYDPGKRMWRAAQAADGSFYFVGSNHWDVIPLDYLINSVVMRFTPGGHLDPSF